LTLRLAAEVGSTRLELHAAPPAPSEPPLTQKILRFLAERGPCWQDALRDALRVRKQDLIDALRDLESSRRVLRGRQGWSLPQGS
jgi:hypothetical protein